MATKVAQDRELIAIRPIETRRMKIRIIGDTPLIVHAWSAKAKREMLETQLGWKTLKKKREPKNPNEDFVSSMYWLTPMPEDTTDAGVEEAVKNAKFGVRVTAIKAAACSAAYRMGWSKNKVSLYPAFFIEAAQDGYYSGDLVIDESDKKIHIIRNVYKYEPMLELKSEPPILREDTVTVGNGNSDLRYRGEFHNWSIDFDVKFNVNSMYTEENIINILNAGGYACGIGEYRVEKGGQYGTYHVEAV